MNAVETVKGAALGAIAEWFPRYPQFDCELDGHRVTPARVSDGAVVLVAQPRNEFGLDEGAPRFFVVRVTVEEVPEP